ncbi:MAG: preprotein translocase subunit SecE [Tractidigestivibacter sp.]|jgi:preprotein translocase subunit SecE|uniref:preprotein translocase subunit SecE n=1 Tax=Tractidigestivibacter sp. TaxID=2847320 RepID=UPI003D8D6F5B
MPNKDRNKRSVRKARQEERARRDAAREASQPSSNSNEKGTKSDKEAAKTPAKSSKDTKAKKDSSKKKPGLITRFKNYVADVKVEMHRVVWPSKQELRNYSVAVIVSLVVVGVVLWLVDTGIVALLAGYTSLGA